MLGPEGTVHLVMDVDTGVDDCLALMCALASPRVDLLAVMCSAGNVPAPQAAANTLAVLELCGASDVEVAVGSVAPILEPLRTAISHGPRGLGYAELPEAKASASPRFASDLLVEEARRRPGEILLVVTGPMTNLALAVRREPQLPGLLRRLAIMGGSFDYPGNTTPAAEFNIAVDPEAASIVLNAFSAPGVPRPLICGLNVTERAEFRPAHLRRLAALAGSSPDESLDPGDPSGARSQASNAVVRCISDALRFKMEAHLAFGQGYVAHMHDPLALALAVDPSLGETRPGRVDVELWGPLTRGMTVVDWRADSGRPHNADVAVKVDVARFQDELIERLSALAGRVGR